MPDRAFRAIGIVFLSAWPVFVLAQLGWLEDIAPACRAKVIRALGGGALMSYGGFATATFLRARRDRYPQY